MLVRFFAAPKRAIFQAKACLLTAARTKDCFSRIDQPSQLGWIEGRNLAIEVRLTAGKHQRATAEAGALPEAIEAIQYERTL
jgi:hypothetical protein